jgi:hypothetical protein
VGLAVVRAPDPHRDTACAEGARVGQLGLSLEHNPYSSTDPLHAEWRRCWQSALAAQAQRAA